MTDINKFLKNVEYITGKPEPDSGQRVNVLYLTTACNLECDYCYEIKDRKKLDKQEHMSMEQAESFLAEIAEREKGHVSTLVIMGGESMLIKERLLGVLRRARAMEHQFGISVVTNGTLLHKFKLTDL
jgi:sulfatase maturation enzyme AslB (radical SAM superfamily)